MICRRLLWNLTPTRKCVRLRSPGRFSPCAPRRRMTPRYRRRLAMGSHEPLNGGEEEDKRPDHGREFYRSYRWMILYPPWISCISGITVMTLGMFMDRTTWLLIGASLVACGAFLPRVDGQLEFGPKGVKAKLMRIPAEMVIRYAEESAREVAEATVPTSEPARQKRVDELVDRAVSRATMRASPPISDLMVRAAREQSGVGR